MYIKYATQPLISPEITETIHACLVIGKEMREGQGSHLFKEIGERITLF